MSDRELFIDEIKKNQCFLNICKIKGMYPDEMLVLHTDGEFKFSDARLAFEAWQASVNREGYKLVPTTPTMKVYNRLFAEHDLGEDRVTYIYKDIMDVSE